MTVGRALWVVTGLEVVLLVAYWWQFFTAGPMVTTFDEIVDDMMIFAAPFAFGALGLLAILGWFIDPMRGQAPARAVGVLTVATMSLTVGMLGLLLLAVLVFASGID